ncbi:MAG: TRAP transporter large permease [Desulfobacterales bacterium]|jgi:C4-dicarboxylate transporter DctM subunit|nr:TRAP transporter large permease [Desulfobacterales bacterium]
MDIDVIIILLLLLGAMAAYVPVYIALFFTGLLGFVFFAPEAQTLMLVQGFFKSMDNFALVVVLFFILCGNIMTAGSIVEKLIKFVNVLVSWLPGGLGMAGCLGCGLFGAISGSTVATVVALGGFMIPALIRRGYPENYAVGLMTTSPNLGIIIPPSISMILYCMITNVSLQGLFLTGFVPGVLIMGMTCLYTYLLFRSGTVVEKLPVPDFKQFLAVFKDCFWSLMLPVIIFAGTFSGMFTANEAAVVACVYAFFVELFIHKTMKFRDVKKVVVNSAVTSATLLVIVAGATCFGRFLTFENVPAKIAEAVITNIDSPLMFLIMINLFLLGVGMFMDVISATLIIGPVLIPLLPTFDIDFMHFGLLMTVNLAIGYCTPPVGVSMYIAGAIANKNILFVTRAVIPFLLIQMAVLLLMTYFPGLVLWLPKAMGFWEAIDTSFPAL